MSARRLAAVAAAVPILLTPAVASAAPVKAPEAKPTATGYGGAAATVDPYATQAAIDVLRRGGNAVDATVAAAGALGVVEPYAAGIGGGGYMVIRTRRGKVTTIDGRETAPAAYTPTTLLDPQTQKPLDFDEAVTSGLGVGTPGTVATWDRALRRYGSRPLRQLLRPSIALAARGFTVDEELQEQTEGNAERFADFDATAALYLPDGKPIQAGTTLRNPDLAKTYRQIARRGPDGFYGGEVGADIVKTVTTPPVRAGATRNVRPGVMTADDLANYKVVTQAPVSTRYRGNRVYGMAPSSSGGSTVLEGLNIMTALGEPATEAATTLFRYIEASKLAFADRNQYIGDPRFVDNPISCLLSARFASDRARLIGERAAQTPVAPGECTSATPAGAENEGPSTTHLTVADKWGNVVAYTFTLEQFGGSGIVVPGRGFILNNQLTDFNFEPGTANSPAANKRPRSSMSPTIVTRNGRPALALGSPGGASIITTVFQTLVNRYERGMTLPEAIAAPRISNRNSAATEAEPAFTETPEYAALQQTGEKFEPEAELGTVAAVATLSGGRMQAAAEPTRRGGGSAMVVRTRKNGR